MRTVSCLSQTAGSVVAASTAVIVRLSMTAGATLTLPSTVTVTVSHSPGSESNQEAHSERTAIPSQSGISELFSFD